MECLRQSCETGPCLSMLGVLGEAWARGTGQRALSQEGAHLDGGVLSGRHEWAGGGPGPRTQGRGAGWAAAEKRRQQTHRQRTRPPRKRRKPGREGTAEMRQVGEPPAWFCHCSDGKLGTEGRVREQRRWMAAGPIDRCWEGRGDGSDARRPHRAAGTRALGRWCFRTVGLTTHGRRQRSLQAGGPGPAFVKELPGGFHSSLLVP